MKIRLFPANKLCAFTITDDADDAAINTVKAIYEFLDTIGIKATKTVWVNPAHKGSGNPEKYGKLCQGETIQNPDYLALIKHIQTRGHEIGLHLASGGNSTRDETIGAYHFFRDHLGHFPAVNINHGRNADSIYWCRDIISSGFWRWLTSFYCSDRSEGHIPDSPYFWGDYCAQYTKYVRHFKSADINNLVLNPSMPYHEKKKAYVRRWFSATDISSPSLIRHIITEKNILRLKQEGGVCIGYAYLHRFVQNHFSIDSAFAEALEKVRKEAGNCWFTPVSPLLDRLELMHNLQVIKENGTFSIINHNADPVTDVWIEGKPGSTISSGGKPAVIGTSGVANIPLVYPELPAGNQSLPTPCLGKIEKAKLILGQMRLLFIRHLEGRPVQNRGWR